MFVHVATIGRKEKSWPDRGLGLDSGSLKDVISFLLRFWAIVLTPALAWGLFAPRRGTHRGAVRLAQPTLSWEQTD
jgi:hypothetical protein